MSKQGTGVRSKVGFAFIGGALALLVAACGGGESATPTPNVAPTALSAQFAAPTSMITPSAVMTVTSSVLTPTPTVELGRGERVYLNQGCGKCHGDQAEGVTDKGSALAGTTLTLQEFDDALRTAKNGELGTDHIFGPSRISPGGSEALHAWLQTLPAQ